ncbi:MAG: DNA gyrase subunit A, partial [Candidatus Methanomethylophilaceae archaeon]|nr:DNA gyrase subunit A [Candidatus Methanomethylophilaceae archaeon]
MSDEEMIIKEPKLITQSIEKMMSSSYIDYSMSVIIGRALPDARDGLKPVHRRILYAMNDLGISYRSPHKKSARIVGEVLGKYHPHGDSAAYDAMVRLAQPFSLRYPLVDGQGNFGSVDGDSAAAMRYTEARLSRMASDLLADIEKETVDMVRNFDESLWEPSVLPSKFPNLLLNGSSGIAVGMATNIPPHNFREVVDAINYTIDNPDADVYQLMDYIKGPDFPTGGTIHGLSGIISAYSTGRGRIRVRSKTHFETLHSGKTAIVVTEIPYQVNKSKLVSEIAERAKAKEIEGITDLRDESDRDGMRIVIELHKDAIEEVVLENLFKFTQMQVTFGIINLALVNGKPQVLTLKQMIEQYILHRKDVVTRRTRFDLAEAEKKEHILEAYMAAFNMLDATIELIRNSKDTETANIGLQELLGIDDIQAKAILDLKLQKLTGLEIEGLREEYDANTRLIADYKDILAHEGRILAIIKDELNQMKEAYGDDRRTEIDVNDIDVDEEDLIPEEDVVVTITEDNYIKRIPLRTYKQQGRGGVGLMGMQTTEEDTVVNMFVTSSHNYVMFVTNTGRLLWLKGYRIPEGGRQSKGKPIVNILSDLQDGEKVLSVIYTREFTDDKFIVFCTRNGLIKKTPLSASGTVRQKGIKAIKLEEGDALVETRIVDGDE